MSKLDETTLRKVAELARLQLGDAEVKNFTVQVGKVLEYIEKLSAIDTTGVEPLTHALDLVMPTRADETRPSPGTGAILACAPEHLYESFKVPQVMGGGH